MACTAPEGKCILHYHLFKNAGTSVDAVLARNFPGGTLHREFSSDPALNRQELADWLREHSDNPSFSSHTALLPVPQLRMLQVLPIIFVRHPLDRIASAYLFEREQSSDEFGAVLARRTTFAGYVDVRLSIEWDRQCRNFHTFRLAHGTPRQDRAHDELHRALDTVAALPFVGLVEAFDASMLRLQAWLRDEGFDGFEAGTGTRENVTLGRSANLDRRLGWIRDELGDDLYSRLEEANASDLALHGAVQARYAAS